MARAAQSLELNQTLINQGLTRNDNENVQFGYLKSLEPQILNKKTRGYIKKCNLFFVMVSPNLTKSY